MVRLNKIRGDLVEASADAGSKLFENCGRVERVSCFVGQLLKQIFASICREVHLVRSVVFAETRVLAKMYDGPSIHPVLAQVPLTVSPFLSLPAAVTLPYTYKSTPTSLPPSLLAEPSDGSKPKYVISSSGHSASPDDIIASCQALQKHVQDKSEESAKKIRDWEDGIREKELAEKRRVAPGWLDREEKILEPVKAREELKKGASLLDSGVADDQAASQMPAIQAIREGEELDRAFGGLDVK